MRSSSSVYEKHFRDFAISAAKLSVKTLVHALIINRNILFFSAFHAIPAVGSRKNASHVFI
jgi:hypothetical protein